MSKARELAELGAVYDSGALSNRNMILLTGRILLINCPIAVILHNVTNASDF